MDLSRVQHVQNNHAERLARLEKHQANESAIKSAWNSPFPSAIGGTPQHGPVQLPPGDLFDDFEEHGQNLLGSLHIDAEDEPTRRGAASRANSVRFDESALQSSSWAQNGRHSGDFGPVRPGSGMGGMMERSLSHKSDGRHSSAGYSVHSVHSHHSIASGRGSSLGLDTNYATTGSDDDSPVSAPAPPPGLFVLGSVPSIIRCWLTPNFAHDTLLYADICTGSVKSVIEFSMVKDLDLVDEVHRDLDGVHRIRLAVYLTEASVVSRNSRNSHPAPQIPSLTANFEVVGLDQQEIAEAKKEIRIFIGSETLREHSADILFSQNLMTLYGTEKEKLSVPFVRPEDNSMFKRIRTFIVPTEKPKLNATARPFVFGDSKQQSDAPNITNTSETKEPQEPPDQMSPSYASEMPSRESGEHRPHSMPQSVNESEKQPHAPDSSDGSAHDQTILTDGRSETQSESSHRREPTASGIWSSWRQGASGNGNETRDTASLSGYQPAGRPRNMKVLKPSKTSSSGSARTGAAYEPPPLSRTSGEYRRKSQPAADNTPTGTMRWKPERIASAASDSKPAVTSAPRDSRSASSATRTNPIGDGSAFSWMNPIGKPKAPTTAAE
ncbi:hypothetical protein BX600DRAFT_508967 [Xylariales sp. PMI_506]|nr:hypothetical protein BX600DRAFT_508967 [Xylariales sp. PMI_506]